MAIFVLLWGGRVDAASYVRLDAVLIDPIQCWAGCTGVHPYAGMDLAPGSTLIGAALGGADLNRADLRAANLSNATLSNANLAGADLSAGNLLGANLSGALYTSNTAFPVGFDPDASAMSEAIVINNGLNPPNPSNVIEDFPTFGWPRTFFVQNESCNKLFETQCPSPGSATSVSGVVQQIRVSESSFFEGFVSLELRAYDSSHADVDLGSSGARVSAHDSSIVVARGADITVDAEAFDDSQLELSGFGWERIRGFDRSRILFTGSGYDDSNLQIFDESFADVRGYLWNLGVGGSASAIVRSTATLDFGMFVGPGATATLAGGGHGELGSGLTIAGELQMTGGLVREAGISVSGHATILGGAFSAASDPYINSWGFAIPGPWNFASEENGVIDLYGSSLGEFVRIAARDTSKVRVYGSEFSVDGQPVPWGTLLAPSGVLTGTLQSGEVLDNVFGQQGGDCGGIPCTGRILVLAPGIDWDQDAKPNVFDNCAEEPNPEQLDTDLDGSGDACSAPLDLDRDGIVDALDNCRTDANADQSDADLDGIGDVCDEALVVWTDLGTTACTSPPQPGPYSIVAGDLANGSVIDRAEQPCDCMGIEMPVGPGTASVRFVHVSPAGVVKEVCENAAPFAFGLAPGQPNCSTSLAQNGTHLLMATPYSAPGCEAGGGDVLPSSIRHFEVTVPEPGIVILLGSGVIGIAVVGRIRGRSRK